MSAEKIVKKITEDAKKEAKSIINEAKNSAERLLMEQKESARNDAKKETSQILEEAKREAEETTRQILTEAKMRANWAIISEKQKLIDGIWEEVRVRIGELTRSKEHYIPFLRQLIKKAATSLNSSKLEILLNEKDSKLPLKLEELSRVMKKESGLNVSFKVGRKKLSAIGGVVVQTPDEKMIVDATFETILERRRRGLELKISNVLFAD